MKKAKAKFEKVSEEEYKREIDSKLQERIQLQHKFRGAYLTRRMLEERQLDMKKRIEETEGYNGNVINWMGYEYGLNHFKAVFDFGYYELKTQIQNEEYLKKALLTLGFSEGMFNDIINGRYIKDTNKLKEMEGKKEKEEIKDNEKTNYIN